MYIPQDKETWYLMKYSLSVEEMHWSYRKLSICLKTVSYRSYRNSWYNCILWNYNRKYFKKITLLQQTADENSKQDNLACIASLPIPSPIYVPHDIHFSHSAILQDRFWASHPRLVRGKSQCNNGWVNKCCFVCFHLVGWLPLCFTNKFL